MGSRRSMNLHQILTDYVGEMGRYQVLVIILTVAIRSPMFIHSIGYNFFAATPDHWCSFKRYPELINITDQQWKLISIPSLIKDGQREFSKCTMYSSTSYMNKTKDELREILKTVQNGSSVNGWNQSSCNSWEYDRFTSVQDSLVTEHNLVCDRAWLKSMVATAFAVGWIIGVPIAGYFGDVIGRRKTTLVTVVGTVVLGIAQPFCQNLILFIVVRAVLSAFANGTMILYPYVMEVIGPRYRLLVNSISNSCFAIEAIALAGIAYFLRQRYHFMIITIAPTSVILIAAVFLPESVDWLVAKGKKEEASITIKRMAEINKRSLPEDLDINVQTDHEEQRTSLFDLVRTPGLRQISFIMWTTWFVQGMVYYSITWNASDFGINIYLNVFLSSTAELPAGIMMTPLVKKFGHKTVYAVCSGLAGILLLCTTAVPEKGLLFVILIMCAKAFTSMTFLINYQWSSELYPTVVRSLALAVASFWARIGTLISSYLPLFGPSVLSVICGVFSIIPILPSLLLPDTLNKVLPSSVMAVEDITKEPVAVDPNKF